MPTDPQDVPQLLGEISQGPSAFDQFLDRNQKNLIFLCIAVAVGVAAFLVYQGVATSHERSAGASLCQADDLASLQALVTEYPSTAAAGTAKVALAERQWEENQQPAAIETLKAFIADNPKHPAIPNAKVSLAAKLKFNGKDAEATALFKELAEDPESSYLAPYSFIALGDLAKAAGHADEAESFYLKAKIVVPGNAFSATADQRLANIKVKAPLEIAPPPPPPPPGLVPPPPLTPAPGQPATDGNPDNDVPPVNMVPGDGAGVPPPSSLLIPADTPAAPATPAADESEGHAQESPQEPAVPARIGSETPPAGAPSTP